MSDLQHPDHDAAVADKLLWKMGLPVNCHLCGKSIPHEVGPYWNGETGIERPTCYDCNYGPVYDPSSPQFWKHTEDGR